MDAVTPQFLLPASPLVLDLKEAISSYPPGYRELIANRFGLSGARLTLQEHGKVIGVTRERVRQIEDRFVRRFLSNKDSFRDVVGGIREKIESGALAFCVRGSYPDLLGEVSDDLLLALLDAGGFSEFIINRDSPSVLSCVDRSVFARQEGFLREEFKRIQGCDDDLYSERLVLSLLETAGVSRYADRHEGTLILKAIFPGAVIVRKGAHKGAVLSLQSGLGALAKRCVYEIGRPLSFDEIAQALESEGFRGINQRSLRNACCVMMCSLPGSLFAVPALAHSPAAAGDILLDSLVRTLSSRPEYIWSSQEILDELESGLSDGLVAPNVGTSDVAITLSTCSVDGVVNCGRGRFMYTRAKVKQKLKQTNQFFVEKLEAAGVPLDFAALNEGIEQTRLAPKQPSDSYGRLFRLTYGSTRNKEKKALYGLKCRDLPFKEERLRALEDLVANQSPMSIEDVASRLCAFPSLLPKESEYLKKYGALGPLGVNPFIEIQGGKRASLRSNRYGSSMREVCGSYIVRHGESTAGFGFSGLKSFLVSSGFVVAAANLRYWLDTNPYLKQTPAGYFKLVARPNAQSYYSFF